MGALLFLDGHCRCSCCRYELAGLAARGRCPECGEPYDTHRPARQASADEVARELATAPARAARRYWEDFGPGPRTIMILMSVLGTAGVVAWLGWSAFKALYDKVHFW